MQDPINDNITQSEQLNFTEYTPAEINPQEFAVTTPEVPVVPTPEPQVSDVTPIVETNVLPEDDNVSIPDPEVTSKVENNTNLDLLNQPITSPNDLMTQEEFNKLSRSEQLAEVSRRNQLNETNKQTEAEKAFNPVYNPEIETEYVDGVPTYRVTQRAIRGYNEVMTEEEVKNVEELKKRLNFDVNDYYDNSEKANALREEANSTPFNISVADYFVANGLIEKDDRVYNEIKSLNDSQIVKTYPTLFEGEGRKELATFRLNQVRKKYFDTKPYDFKFDRFFNSFLNGTVIGGISEDNTDDAFTVDLSDKDQASKLETENILGVGAGLFTEGVVVSLALRNANAALVKAGKLYQYAPKLVNALKVLTKNPVLTTAVTEGTLNVFQTNQFNPTLTSIIKDDPDLAYNKLVAFSEGAMFGVAADTVTGIVKLGHNNLKYKKGALLPDLYSKIRGTVDDAGIPTKDAEDVADGLFMLNNNYKNAKVVEKHVGIKDIKKHGSTIGMDVSVDNLQYFKGQTSIEQNKEFTELVEEAFTIREKLLASDTVDKADLKRYVELTEKVNYVVGKVSSGKSTGRLDSLKNIDINLDNGEWKTADGKTILNLDEVPEGIPLTQYLDKETERIANAAKVVGDSEEALFEIQDPDAVTKIINYKKLRDFLKSTKGDSPEAAYNRALTLLDDTEQGKAVKQYKKDLDNYEIELEKINKENDKRQLDYDTSLKEYDSSVKELELKNKDIEKRNLQNIKKYEDALSKYNVELNKLDDIINKVKSANLKTTEAYQKELNSFEKTILEEQAKSTKQIESLQQKIKDIDLEININGEQPVPNGALNNKLRKEKELLSRKIKSIVVPNREDVIKTLNLELPKEPVLLEVPKKSVLKKEAGLVLPKKPKSLPQLSKSDLGIRKPRQPRFKNLPKSPNKPEGYIDKEDFILAYKTVIPEDLTTLTTEQRDVLLDAASKVVDSVGFATKDVLLHTDDVVRSIEIANAKEVFGASTLKEGNEILQSSGASIRMEELKLFKTAYKDAQTLAAQRIAKRKEQIKEAEPIISKIKELASGENLIKLDRYTKDQSTIIDSYVKEVLGITKPTSSVIPAKLSDVDSLVKQLVDTADNGVEFKHANFMNRVAKHYWSKTNSYTELITQVTEAGVKAFRELKNSKNIDVYADSAIGYESAFRRVADDLDIPYPRLLEEVHTYTKDSLVQLARLDAIVTSHRMLEKEVDLAVSTFSKAITNNEEPDGAKVLEALQDLAGLRASVSTPIELIQRTSSWSPSKQDALFGLLAQAEKEGLNQFPASRAVNDYLVSINEKNGLTSFEYVDSKATLGEVLAVLLTDKKKFNIHNIISDSGVLLDSRKPLHKNLIAGLVTIGSDMFRAKLLSGVGVPTVAGISNTILTAREISDRVKGGILSGNTELYDSGKLMVLSMLNTYKQLSSVRDLFQYGFKQLFNLDTDVTRFGFNVDVIREIKSRAGELNNPIAKLFMEKMSDATTVSMMANLAPLSMIDSMTSKIITDSLAEAKGIQKALKAGIDINSEQFKQIVNDTIREAYDEVTDVPTDEYQSVIRRVTLTEPLPVNASFNKNGLAIAAGSYINKLNQIDGTKHPVLKTFADWFTLFTTTLSRASDDASSYLPLLGNKISSVGRQAINGDPTARAIITSRQFDGAVAVGALVGLLNLGILQIDPPITNANEYESANLGKGRAVPKIRLGHLFIDLKDAGPFAPFLGGIAYIGQNFKDVVEIGSDPLLQSTEGSFNANIKALGSRGGNLLYGLVIMSGMEYAYDYIKDFYKFADNPTASLKNINPESIATGLSDLYIPTYLEQAYGDISDWIKPMFNGQASRYIGNSGVEQTLRERYALDAANSDYYSYDLYAEPKLREKEYKLFNVDKQDPVVKEIQRLKSLNPKAVYTNYDTINDVDTRNLYVDGVNAHRLYMSMVDSKGLKEALSKEINSEQYFNAGEPSYTIDRDKLVPIKQSSDSDTKVGRIQRILDTYYNQGYNSFVVTYGDRLTYKKGNKAIPYLDYIQMNAATKSAAQLNTVDSQTLLEGNLPTINY